LFKRKVIVILLSILILGGGALGVKKLLTPKEEVVKISLVQQEKSLAMIPHLLAQEKNFFRDFLVKVQIRINSGDELPQEALARGHADIIVMELADFLYNRYQNADLIAFAAITAREPSFIMAREEMPSFTWQDMRDKSVIGAAPESTAGIMLEAALRENDMAPYRNVTVLYNIPEDLRSGAFQAGSSTYIQTSEPAVSRLEAEGHAFVIKSLAEKNIPSLVYVTNSSIMKRHPEKIQRFTNGIYKSYLWMHYHPEQIAGTLQSHFKEMERNIFDTAVNRYLKAGIWPEEPMVSRDAVKEFLEMMLTAGELPRTFDCSGAVEQRFGRKALEDVEYIPPEQEKKGLQKLWPFS
jgi:NitT/TauT family transport system substrate-binding protein